MPPVITMFDSFELVLLCSLPEHGAVELKRSEFDEARVIPLVQRGILCLSPSIYNRYGDKRFYLMFNWPTGYQAFMRFCIDTEDAIVRERRQHIDWLLKANNKEPNERYARAIGCLMERAGSVS